MPALGAIRWLSTDADWAVTDPEGIKPVTVMRERAGTPR